LVSFSPLNAANGRVRVEHIASGYSSIVIVLSLVISCGMCFVHFSVCQQYNLSLLATVSRSVCVSILILLTQNTLSVLFTRQSVVIVHKLCGVFKISILNVYKEQENSTWINDIYI